MLAALPNRTGSCQEEARKLSAAAMSKNNPKALQPIKLRELLARREAIQRGIRRIESRILALTASQGLKKGLTA